MPTKRTTTAAILEQANRPLVVTEIDVPEPEVGQVLVRIHHSGICGKQIDEITGKRPDPYLPHLLGHEAAGTVEAIGPGVRKVGVGDRVVLHWVKGSGIDSETPKFVNDGVEINAGFVTTFSQHTVVSENRVTQIPESIPTDVAALLGCAVTTGFGIIMNNANVKPGQSVAVFGVGGVGINVIQAAALVNAHPIIAVDIHQDKLEQAKKFGATHIVDSSKTDPVAAIKELTGGNGADASVDTVGAVPVRVAAYDSASNAGTVVFAGVPGGEDRMTVDSFPLHFGRKVVGSHGGDTVPDVDIPRYARLYELGLIKLDEQISHRFPLSKVNEAVELVRSGDATRVVLEM